MTCQTRHIAGSVLDVGAGSAKYREIIKEMAQKYTAFDSFLGDNIDVVGDVLNMPFEKNYFDTVISTQVLEHIERPWIAVREINRVLKKGGKCILSAPFLLPFHADPQDYFRFTKDGLESLVKNEKMKIIESGSYGKTFSVVSEALRFLFFNRYQNKSKGKWRKRIIRLMAKTAFFLDKFSGNRIIYANSYVVAEKTNE